MENKNICICGKSAEKDGICGDCRILLRAKRSKNIGIVEKFREDYNRTHNLYKSYGQFVLMLDLIARRKKYFDHRRKKDNFKKIRSN